MPARSADRPICRTHRPASPARPPDQPTDRRPSRRPLRPTARPTARPVDVMRIFRRVGHQHKPRLHQRIRLGRGLRRLAARPAAALPPGEGLPPGVRADEERNTPNRQLVDPCSIGDRRLKHGRRSDGRPVERSGGGGGRRRVDFVPMGRLARDLPIDPCSKHGSIWTQGFNSTQLSSRLNPSEDETNDIESTTAVD